MPNFIDITGQRFGRLVVIQKIGRAKSGMLWLCRCDCGNSTPARAGNLHSGNTSSCGCGERESRFQIQHGQAYSPLYKTWSGMMQRCYNPKSPVWRYYGARGIGVYDHWHIPENFIVYILANIGERPPGKSIDRINNDRGYEPGNIQWATPSEQARNRRKWKNRGWKLRRSRIRNVAYIRVRDR